MDKHNPLYFKTAYKHSFSYSQLWKWWNQRDSYKSNSYPTNLDMWIYSCQYPLKLASCSWSSKTILCHTMNWTLHIYHFPLRSPQNKDALSGPVWINYSKTQGVIKPSNVIPSKEWLVGLLPNTTESCSFSQMCSGIFKQLLFHKVQ